MSPAHLFFNTSRYLEVKYTGKTQTLTAPNCWDCILGEFILERNQIEGIETKNVVILNEIRN